MLYRFVARQWRPRRFNVTATQNPVFSNNVFSKHVSVENVLDLPLNTYPNPLYRLSKSQLLGLRMKEIQHLIKIPARSLSETDQFHKHIIEIFHDNLIKDTKLAVLYLDLIEPLMRESVFEHLRSIYANETLRLPILAFIENPSSPSCRKMVRSTIYTILDKSNEDKETAANIALNFISKLALTGRVNTKPIFISHEYLKLLYQSIPKDQWVQLFAALVQTNIKFSDYDDYLMIRDHLQRGSALDRFVARTGILGAKWHDTEEPYLSDAQKQKMVLYFLLSDLARFTQQAIRQRDVTMLNMYLELLVTSFESMGDLSHLQLVLSVMISHSMAFKGPQECLKFLRYIIESELEIAPQTMLRILTALRLDKYYDEALLLVNYLHREALSSGEHVSLVGEIMKVITGKFNRHPKVAFGYFVSLFNDTGDIALHTLKDLLLLDLAYGPGILISAVEHAQIHDSLKGSAMTHDILRDVYLVTLRSLPAEQRTSPVLMSKLYEEYRKKIEEAEHSNNRLSPFSPSNIDERILTLFLDQLLRVDAEARDNLDLIHDLFRFATSKRIFDSFFEAYGMQGSIKNTYIFDLMISSALLKHRDLAYALNTFKKARDLGLPITFNQVYPLILHHYLKGEMDKAERWFMLLMQSGAKAKSRAADRLFDIAREQKWAHTGTRYRNAVRVKVRSARDEMAKLKNDPLTGPKIDTGGASGTEDTKLGEELEQILHELALKKK